MFQEGFDLNSPATQVALLVGGAVGFLVVMAIFFKGSVQF